MFPLGQPGFVSHPIDRAAHLRLDDDKLFALEERGDTRAFVVHRDSIILKQEPEGMRAALTIREAREFGANPGTVFLGLRDGKPLFGMGIAASAVEELLTRSDAVVGSLRTVIAEGRIPVEDLSAIAIAKSLVNWHQRHGFCANCGVRTSMTQGGWRRDCPSCRAEHFPRTDPVVIMLVEDGDRCLLGRQAQFPKGMWSCLAGFVEASETMECAVQREVLEEAGVQCADVRYYMTQPWPYPSSMMIGCTARAVTTAITIDHTEIEDARWFARAEVELMFRREHPEGFTGPHPVAIAHHLVADWLKRTA